MKPIDFESDNRTPVDSRRPDRSESPENRPDIDPFAEWEPGQVILDDYTIRLRVGSGGMGVVYLVERSITGGVIQFAVKTLQPSLFSRSGANKALLRELRTWMSLPPHPNIVSCRFFRTIENRIAIFSEYVDGGSLSDWIEDDRIGSLETILDIAIQTAWALQTIHDRNVIHQDVKPSNILLTQDGIAKLTDFGISNACRSDSSDPATIPTGQHSILVSTRGCTPAYCSPEQAVRGKVTRHTDMWSWAVTVLQMFTGKVRWTLGVTAPDYLQTISSVSESGLRFKIPEPLHRLLQRCMQENRQDRWKTMSDIGVLLTAIYRDVSGKSYDRQPPESTPDDRNENRTYSRITFTGWSWADPERLLKRAHEAFNLPYHASTNRNPGTRAEMLLADLETFEDAIALFRQLPEKKSVQYLDDIIGAVSNKAILLTELNDLSGAIVHYEQAIDWIERNRALPDRKKTALLLDLYKRKADALLIDHSLHEAEETYQLIQSMFRERKDLPDVDLMLSHRIRSTMNLAYTLYLLGRNREALVLYDELLEEMTMPVYREQVPTADIELGTLRLNRGLALWQLNHLNEALNEYDEAIALQRTREYQATAPAPTSDLAKTLSNKALILQNLGRFEESECHSLEAILLIENQLLDSAKPGLKGLLGLFYTNLAGMYAERNDLHLGLKYVKKARTILDRNVHLEGVREFESQIARMLICEASCLAGLQNFRQAFEQAKQATGLLERLTYEFNRIDLKQDLARCYVTQAVIMEAAGLFTEASDIAAGASRLCANLIEEFENGEMQMTLMISRCIETRIRLKTGAPDAVREARRMMCLLAQEYEKTGYHDLVRHMELLKSTLQEFDPR